MQGACMRAWNVVVTVRPGALEEVRRLLHDLGQVGDSPYDNVLLLRAEEPVAALHTLQLWCRINPWLRAQIDHVVPITHAFAFETCDEFDSRATESLREWLPALAGRSVRVRSDSHGAPPDDECRCQEAALGAVLARALQQSGASARPGDGDPDWIIALECLGQWVGLSLWSRGQVRRYPELGLGPTPQAG